ncbi:hypothetical protein AVEN_178551-1, partial [Araneus ventricosus]
MLILCSSS